MKYVNAWVPWWKNIITAPFRIPKATASSVSSKLIIFCILKIMKENMDERRANGGGFLMNNRRAIAT